MKASSISFRLSSCGRPVQQRHHVDAEHALHLGLLVEVVEHHIGGFAALDLDVDAHAVLVGLVAQLGDAFDLLFLDQLGDLLDQARLVHLVRKLGDDDRFAAGVLVTSISARARIRMRPRPVR
jgi:enoyl-CoA hydratase/carnithine racemase